MTYVETTNPQINFKLPESMREAFWNVVASDRGVRLESLKKRTLGRELQAALLSYIELDRDVRRGFLQRIATYEADTRLRLKTGAERVNKAARKGKNIRQLRKGSQAAR